MTKPRRSGPTEPVRPRISVVIFDLDDTLYDCFGQRVQVAHRHAAEAMAAAGVPATAEEIFKYRWKAFETDPTLTHIDAAVLKHFGGPEDPEIVRLSRAAFFTAPVGELTLFEGTLPLLRELRRRGVRIFVVSFGDPETQRAKVKALGLDQEASVERIFYADTGKLLTKEAIFRTILRHAQPDPAKVLVVGDRPSSEIKAGKALGMHTVRLRHGEFVSQEPAGPEETPEHEIRAIGDLLKLPYRFGKEPASS